MVLEVNIFIIAHSGFMNSGKRDGEREHPCLARVRFCAINPLVVTVADGDVYNAQLQLIQLFSKPKFLSAANRNSQLTFSNVIFCIK